MDDGVLQEHRSEIVNGQRYEANEGRVIVSILINEPIAWILAMNVSGLRKKCSSISGSIRK